MPLEYKTGRVEWLTTDALSSTKVVTGLGFTPKAMRFVWNSIQSTTSAVSASLDLRNGIGFAVSATSRRTIGSYSQDASGNSNCGSVAANDCVVVTVDGAGTIDGKLDISSFDANGFTLIVDDVTPANLTVIWEAWGGDDITVAVVGDAPEPAATGNVSYTVTGFTTGSLNQVIMFAGVQSTAALNTGQAQDAGISVGQVTSGQTNSFEFCMTNSEDDGSATMDVNGANMFAISLNKVIIAGGTGGALINSYASLQSWDANGFTLNWLARATTGRRNIYLAIKGGQWVSGRLDLTGTTPPSVITNFTPKGVTAFASSILQTQGFAFNYAAYTESFGSADSTANQASFSANMRYGITTSEWYTNIDVNDVISMYAFPGNSWASNVTFQPSGLDFTAPSGFNLYIRYLTFGDETPPRKPRTVSVGHPFII